MASYAQGARTVIDEFPVMSGYISKIQTTKATKNYASWAKHKWVKTADGKYVVQPSNLNFAAMQSNLKLFDDAMAKEIARRYHPKGWTPQHIMVHEYAHAIDDLLLMQKMGLKTGSVVPLEKANAYAQAARVGSNASDIIGATLKNMGIDPVGREAYNAYKHLGSYGIGKKSELFAQAMAEAMVTPNPSRFSVELLKEVKRRLQ